jgi:hypothetical protein
MQQRRRQRRGGARSRCDHFHFGHRKSPSHTAPFPPPTTIFEAFFCSDFVQNTSRFRRFRAGRALRMYSIIYKPILSFFFAKVRWTPTPQQGAPLGSLWSLMKRFATFFDGNGFCCKGCWALLELYYRSTDIRFRSSTQLLATFASCNPSQSLCVN